MYSHSSEFDKYDEPRLHMERLMRTRLFDFELPIRILIPLEDAGIRTLEDLTKQTKKSLQEIRLLGKISIDKLEKFLAYHELPLAE